MNTLESLSPQEAPKIRTREILARAKLQEEAELCAMEICRLEKDLKQTQQKASRTPIQDAITDLNRRIEEIKNQLGISPIGTWHQEHKHLNIGSGGTTTVFRLEEKAAKRSRPFVIKPFDTFYLNHVDNRRWRSDKHGFNIGIKEYCEHQYALMRQSYGPYIPQMRIIPNPEHPNRFYIAQEYIEFAKTADIFDYQPIDFSDEGVDDVEKNKNAEVRKQLLDLASRLKENILQAIAGQKEVAVLDTDGAQNIVLSNDNKIYYVDSSVMTDPGMGQLLRSIVHAVHLELLGGKTLAEIRKDRFYIPQNSELLWDAQQRFLPLLNSATDEGELYANLRDAYNMNT